ncbi:unnamed protein product [Owenia fusiformis]|uniref:Uncharacterized protein n=1 Tax=Owenia fusiformis TaxID=6347 RepID=A0A8J1TUW6_OWEFU|nr:unnamed protein product [Owenia fusiformis]
MASPRGVNELSKLRAENIALAEELAQCQADKEFVWSLWKRLQVASPDITQSIGLVIQREKEKAELKDRKVLGILQLKDDKIEQLQKTVASQSKELSEFINRKLEIQDEVNRLLAENHVLRQQHTQLKQQVVSIGEEKTSSSEQNQKEIYNLKQEKYDFNQRITDLSKQCAILNSDKADLTAVKHTLENKIKGLETELKMWVEKHASVSKDHDESRKLLKKCEVQLKKHTRDIEAKNKELENVRKELSELWMTHRQCTEHASAQNDIIQQLQALQHDTQKVLETQETKRTLENKSLQQLYNELEVKYAATRDSENQLRQDTIELNKQLLQSESEIRNLQKQVDDLDVANKSIATQASLENEVCAREEAEKIADLESEVDDLTSKIAEQNRIIRRLETSEALSPRPLSPIHNSSPHPRSRSDRSPFRSERSPMKSRLERSPVRSSPKKISQTKELQRRLESAEKKYKDAQHLIKLKGEELKQLRSAHSRRLDRLKALQADHKLLRQQLVTAEEELHGVKRKKAKLSRSTPKDLQNEDTDTVWNELTYFKQENKNLQVERMNLSEEVDTLRVQTKQDAATIHELNMCIEQEKQELRYALDEISHSKPEYENRIASLKEELNDAIIKLKISEDELDSLRGQCDNLLKTTDNVETEKLSWMDERRAYKSEVNELKESEANYRIQIADLKRDIHRLNLQLRVHASKGSPSTPNRRRAPVGGKQKLSPSRHYQKMLNKSIEKMSNMIEGFNDDDWQEVSDSGDESNDLEESTGTEASLGANIVKATRRTQAREDPIASNVAVKDVATSPLKSGRRAMHRGNTISQQQAKQQSLLRHRVSSLQQQVSILRGAKQSLQKSLNGQKSLNEQLQSDLNVANQRLLINRREIQKLGGDLEKAAIDKDMVPPIEKNQHTESDWKHLQNRLRDSANEVSKQSTLIKSLREENDELREQIKQLNERVNRLERDNGQKRILLEDVRLKLKISQENANTDTKAMAEVENRLRSVTETSDRFKTQCDSLRKRLGVATKEKQEYEENYRKTSAQLDKKTKAISELQAKVSELQSSLQEVERMAERQLYGLANQSEEAIETAQNKLVKMHTNVQEYQSFLKNFSHDLLRSIQQTRAEIYRQKHKPSTTAESLRKAKLVAGNILNLSQSDVEELMIGEELKSQATELEQGKKRDQKWSKKLEKILTKKEFESDLTEMMSEKLEEKLDLIHTLYENR